MNKIYSLIKATMSDGINIFKINTKKKTTFTKIMLPIILTMVIMGAVCMYSCMIIESLKTVNLEVFLLTLFIMITSFLIVIEGVYKSGDILFKCKDDNLLLSLPIKKRTVLLLRIFKFYTFELLYNSMLLVPAMLVYAMYTKPNISYYLISLLGLLVFPIIPILISCLIGTFTTYVASKFKGKNIVQTIISFAFILCVLYISYNYNGAIATITEYAENLNQKITSIYYPIGAYIELITDFNIVKMIEFLVINIGLFIITIVLISKLYFNINSNMKAVAKKKTSRNYKITTSKPLIALVKKEINRFVNSPVFITNAGFGLVLYIILCILVIVKYDNITNMLLQGNMPITLDIIEGYLPVFMFVFIVFTSFMTSITSSMISLEGKSFNILKSLPINPQTIVKSKILTAVIIIIPCILLGDLMIFIRFKFELFKALLIIVSSFLLPYIAETMGLLINLKYPKMDANNDTEVVKQSMSSTISVFLGMGIIGITMLLLFSSIMSGMNSSLVLAIFVLGYTIIYFGLRLLLNRTCENSINNIVV